MARGTTSYYGRRYTIATPMTHLYMLCACIFCWIVGYVDSVGYPVYGRLLLYGMPFVWFFRESCLPI